MAKSKAKAKSKKGQKPASKKAERISKIIEQAKEPLSLIETLKEEGMARAGYLLGVAAEMAGGVTKEGVMSQLKEVPAAVGIATKEEVRALKKQISALEDRIEQLEAKLGVSAAEDDDESSEEEEEIDTEEFRVKDDLSDFSDMDEDEETDEDPEELN